MSPTNEINQDMTKRRISSKEVSRRSLKSKYFRLLSIKMLMVTMVLIQTMFVPLTDACSCLHSHPQEHYCSADFVSLVEVVQSVQETKSSTMYKMVVKNEFKVNKGSKEALEKGTFYTPSHETSCGRKFEPNIKYLITGRVINGQAWVSLCNYAEEWNKMSREQKKGFKKWYSMGCSCTIQNGPFKRSLQVKQENQENQKKKGMEMESKSSSCSWDTKFEGNLDCQGLYTICVPISAAGVSAGVKQSVIRKRSSAVAGHHLRRSNMIRRRTSLLRDGRGRKRLSFVGHRRQRNGQNEVETESTSGSTNCNWIPSTTYFDCMRNRTNQADDSILKKLEKTQIP